LEDVVTASHPDRLETVADELARAHAAFVEVPDLLRALHAPTVPPDRKTAVLDEVLTALAIEEPARRFLHVLQQHYRLEQLADILDAYREQVDRRLGRVRARVEVAETLSKKDRSTLLETLGTLTGAEVVATFEAVPALLAGFRIHLGSKLFDGSLVGQIDHLASQNLSESLG
jgi:F-type H+-transporting ATPase subunit delta